MNQCKHLQNYPSITLLVVFFFSFLFAEGTGNFGGAGALNQELKQSTTLFVHVDAPDKFIRLYLRDNQGASIDVEANIFATTVNANGVYEIAGGVLQNLLSAEANIGNVDMTQPLPADPSTGSKMEYQVGSAGVYAIQFVSHASDPNNRQAYSRWDVSVVENSTDSVDPQAMDGNLFSYDWQMITGSFAESRGTNSQLYALVPGGYDGTNYVWVLDLQGYSGYEYQIVANDVGLNAPYSGYSVPDSVSPAPGITPQFPVYLNYPHGANPGPEPTELPDISDTFTFISNDAANTIISPDNDGVQDAGVFQFTPTSNGTYAITIDLDRDGIYGNSSDRILIGRMKAGELVQVQWFGENNDGGTVPNGTYPVQLSLRLGEYHFVTYDTETSGGGTDDGLTIFRAPTDSTTVGTLVYWEDEKYLGGQSVMPSGVLSEVGVPTGAFRHTWGNFTSTSIGDSSYIDTYVFGLSNTPSIENVTVVDKAGEQNEPEIVVSISDQVKVINFDEYTIDLTTVFEDNETTDENLIFTITSDSLIDITETNGSITISSITNEIGVDTVIITATDESGISVSDTVVWTIVTLDLPDSLLVSGKDDTATVSIGDTFDTTGTVTYDIVSLDSSLVVGTIDDTGTVVLELSDTSTGETDVIVTITDPDGSTITDTIHVTIFNLELDDVIVDSGTTDTTVIDFDSVWTSTDSVEITVISLDSSLVVGTINDSGELVLELSDTSTGETDVIVTITDTTGFIFKDTIHVTIFDLEIDDVVVEQGTTDTAVVDFDTIWTGSDSAEITVVSLDSSLVVGTINDSGELVLELSDTTTGETDVIVTITDTTGATFIDTVHVTIFDLDIEDIVVDSGTTDTTVIDFDTVWTFTDSVEITVESMDSSLVVGTINDSGELELEISDTSTGETDLIITTTDTSGFIFVDTVHVTVTGNKTYGNIFDYDLGHIEIPEVFEVVIAPNPAPALDGITTFSIAKPESVDRVDVTIFSHVGDVVSRGDAELLTPLMASYEWDFHYHTRSSRSGSFLAVIRFYENGTVVKQMKNLIGIQQ